MGIITSFFNILMGIALTISFIIQYFMLHRAFDCKKRLLDILSKGIDANFLEFRMNLSI